MQNAKLEPLLDRIYEAAIVPSEWPLVLDMISKEIGGLGGLLFAASEFMSTGVTSAGFEGIRTKFVSSGWSERNIRVSRLFERDLLGLTVTDQDLATAEELRSHPQYEYMRQIGGGWCVGFTTQAPTGDTLVASFERAHARGAFQASEVAFIESLRPHFSRSALLTARLGMERARAAAETMGVIGLPAGVVAHNNRLIAANALLSDMIPSVILDGRDRVRLANPKADAMMRDACARLSKDKGVGTALSIPIPGSEERKALVVHIVPVRRAAHDIFSGALCLLVVTPLARKDAPPASLIQGLFDLTSAEAKVAKGLAAGETAQEIALRLGNSLGTIRTHIKSIFLKTGITKQADLVALLAGVSL